MRHIILIFFFRFYLLTYLKLYIRKNRTCDHHTHETKMSSQSSTVAKFHHALDLLAESSPPHQPGLVMRLSELCHDLKQGGAALEEAGAELDTLQARLVQVCQQSGLDLELRLQILELVELRALGWRSNRGMEQFYAEKFSEARAAKARQLQEGNPDHGAVDDAHASADPAPTRTAEEGETETEATFQRQLVVGESTLVLRSCDRPLVQLARQQLETFFSGRSAVRVAAAGDAAAAAASRRLEVDYTAPERPLASLKYSREALLTLATNQLAQVSSDYH